jgi:hypothetical protein
MTWLITIRTSPSFKHVKKLCFRTTTFFLALAWKSPQTMNFLMGFGRIWDHVVKNRFVLFD